MKDTEIAYHYNLKGLIKFRQLDTNHGDTYKYKGIRLYSFIINGWKFEIHMPHRKGTMCPWLRPKTRRRTLEDIQTYLTPTEVYELIISKEWQYKGGQFNRKGTQYGRDKYHSRDKALLALLYLTSGRINEVLRVKKSQFFEMEDLPYYKEPDSNILILKDFFVSKRKKGKKNPILDLPLPRLGNLSPFTELVENYLIYLSRKKKLFKFSTSRAWTITNHITGKWNHYFRAQSLSYQVNLIGSALRVARQRGIANPTTIAHYYRGEWLVDKDKVLEGRTPTSSSTKELKIETRKSIKTDEKSVSEQLKELKQRYERGELE